MNVDIIKMNLVEKVKQAKLFYLKETIPKFIRLALNPGNLICERVKRYIQIAAIRNEKNCEMLTAATKNWVRNICQISEKVEKRRSIYENLQNMNSLIQEISRENVIARKRKEQSTNWYKE
jgi:multidrug resistance efflux pump